MTKKRNVIKENTKQKHPKYRDNSGKMDLKYDLAIIPVILGAVMIFAVQFFWARTAGYAFLISGLGWWAVQRGARRQGVLLFAFIFAYVISPYWRLNIPGLNVPPLVTAAFLSVIAVFWALYHASVTKNDDSSGISDVVDVKLPDIREFSGWMGLFFFSGIMRVNGLFVDIPWRGDEDSHINHSTGVLVDTIKIFKDALNADTFYYYPLAGFAVFVISFLLRKFLKRYFWEKLSGDKPDAGFCYIEKLLNLLVSYGWIIGVAAVWCIKGYDIFPKWQYRLLRYPFTAIWGAILTGWDVGIKVVVEPWWLRIASFSCFFAASGMTFTWFYRKTADWLCSFLAGISILTMPLVLNYGSMYILEPFILPLALAVFLYPRFYFLNQISDVRKTPQNTAFAMLLLFKETVAPMLGVAGIMRSYNIIRHIFERDNKMVKIVAKEAVYIVFLLFTILPYITLRIISGLRGYSPKFSNLLNMDNYISYVSGLWEQTGIAFLIALIGGLYLIYKKKYSSFFPSFILILIYVVFFTLDGYPGYGRFNFMLLPGVISLFLFALIEVRGFNKILVLIVLSCTICVNLLLSPYDISSGVTKPLWEKRTTCENDTTYYPISKTISWLKENHPETQVALYVHDYRFVAIEWAASRAGLNYIPAQSNSRNIRKAYKEEESVLAELLYSAKLKNIPLVGYLCLNGPEPPDISNETLSGYKLIKIFKNPYRAIAVYSL